ncbi:MBL fold metallo-hydrolase [Occultella glacieicola]|uniref:MBL fold metallo-hydrolase n=1 Tax=Occultella glacieicola TaxID=2518684 RepID=A0ABY2E377_9MICO|nr:MBL fold metallo-hydrolase [Occultella glacieicola]TDE90421.1 MBL fold metallo-hydrolase [Occultella glacieicola]
MNNAPFVPGHVETGGPAAHWTVPGLQIRKASVSAEDNNCYLLTEPDGGTHLIIDAADDAARVLALVTEAGGGPVSAIVTTHRHADHHRALAEVAEATGARVLAGSADADGLPVGVDGELANGDTVALGAVDLAVVGLRGHTPGSVALAFREPRGDGAGRVHLFTGDSLFPGGVGRTGSPEDFASLLDDVEQRLFDVYDDDAVVHPGHGDNTTLGAERGQLAQWRERGW